MTSNVIFPGQSIIDLSHKLTTDLQPFPGDPPLSITTLANVSESGYCLSQISGTAHIGTHVDVPAHFYTAGKTVDQYPASFWMGRAMVVHAVNHPTITSENTVIPDLAGVDFLLFYTGWDEWKNSSKYALEHSVIDSSLADRLSKSQIRGIGIDGPSPDREPYPVHQLLLGAEKILIENMTRLAELPFYQPIPFIVLPLSIQTEACWVRPLAFLPPIV